MDHVKIVVFGNQYAADGKPHKLILLKAYQDQVIPEGYIPTVLDNYSANIMLDVDGAQARPINLMLMDTTGQEDYTRLRPLSFHQTDVIVMLFSVAVRSSLESVQRKWYPEVQRYAKGVPILVVGGDRHLRDIPPRSAESAVATFEEGQAMADTIGAVEYLECSVQQDLPSVNEVFARAMHIAIDPENVRKKRAREREMKKKKCVVL
mmetsp:Transcript_61703/g.102621  ORF Transcript_61703/g.102621 Transcript_61703/m.102621 type:complete len:207 (+) Transcript_61703:211-831(+)|eukprot:CAMPEP_0119298258 /NCGR_PEP_ID=MMETSP1333-20130426/464_1 /TAXON_ID=418940 /ORGANISM="Scyphosphaera apsteinii, Strain RCC1455" /LENGTH=206 /DNA_ID=CAMNT_0007299315 /DNA_START=211 /DNA_END=831 /DNA_ORIENTATION=+